MMTRTDVKYLSEDEINSLITKSVKLVGLDPTQAKILKQILQEETLPVCNQCGHSYHPERYGTIEFNTSWGYESTGKDGDHDSWNLCRTCADEFKKDNPPVCCKCLRSVVYIMGDLAARNTGCTFYGDPEAAQKHMEDINGCGYFGNRAHVVILSRPVHMGAVFLRAPGQYLLPGLLEELTVRPRK